LGIVVDLFSCQAPNRETWKETGVYVLWLPGKIPHTSNGGTNQNPGHPFLQFLSWQFHRGFFPFWFRGFGSSLVIRYFSNLQYLNLLLPSGNLT
jgi:hypothetical protein